MQGCISVDDKKYPRLLKEIKRPPKALYHKGECDIALFDKCVAVVGSRNMTKYGKRATQKLVCELAGMGVTIVSGFMYGIDACSHRSALDVGGRTIAVMPCGIECVHPENQQGLYKDILENGGLVVSEYDGLQRPQIWMYPQRNRIVAGLCRGVLVVEAALDSGSLITAKYARDFGRELFVVPGDIFSKNFGGIYKLMCEGAMPVSSGFSIFECCGFGVVQPDLDLTEQHRVKDSIINLLEFEPLTIDELSRQVELAFDELSSKLALLVLEGKVFEEEGKYYVN